MQIFIASIARDANFEHFFVSRFPVIFVTFILFLTFYIGIRGDAHTVRLDTEQTSGNEVVAAARK